jgi:chromosome segregation ATPase
MQVNTILGRDAEQIQRLMHAQFQFLEHVVLDMSRQMRHLQDQLLASQNVNQKLQGHVENLDQQVKTIQLDQIEKQKANEYHLKLLETGVNDATQALEKLNAKTEQNHQQMQSILMTLNAHDNRIQSGSEKHTLLQDQLKDLGIVSQQSLHQADGIKELIATEQKNTVQERLSLQQTITQLQSQTIDRITALESQFVTKLDKLHERQDILQNTFEYSKKERYQEQETLISVLNTLKTSISIVRQEQKQFEIKTVSNLTNTLSTYKEQISRDMRSATKPIFIQ